MNFSTAADIADWISGQSKPKPPKRTLLMLRPTMSEGMTEFSAQYNRLVKQGISSKTAHSLQMAVLRAETAKDLCSRLPLAIRNSSSIQDALSGLQLSMFAASNWVRRFADDRHKKHDWYIIEEKKAGRDIASGIDIKLKDLFARIHDKTSSKTIQDAFQAYEIKWSQQEVRDLKLAAEENKHKISVLTKLWKAVENQDASDVSSGKKYRLAAYCAELDDSHSPLTTEQRELVNKIKIWLKDEEDEPPVWRVQGIKSLGPFGIASSIAIEMSAEFPEDSGHLPGMYTVQGPKASIELYESALGGSVVGMLSPKFKITIKQSDPVAKLIRIPTAAASFAFAYPVITSSLEVKVVNKSTLDAFLLFGGFVYFDKSDNLIQVNALWVGNNMQMSAPKQVPSNVVEKLKEAGRFHDITLPQLSKVGAKQFAWIMPGEFEDVQTPHGGWCYIYENEEVNNYFAIASAESVMALTKAFSLKDIKSD